MKINATGITSTPKEIKSGVLKIIPKGYKRKYIVYAYDREKKDLILKSGRTVNLTEVESAYLYNEKIEL